MENVQKRDGLELSSIGIWYIIEALVDRQLEIAVNEVSIDSIQGL